jgi:hypothetical protein
MLDGFDALYQDIAGEINQNFRTIFHAIATKVGVSITPCRLGVDIYRMAYMIEFSRTVTSRKNLTVTITDCGIICIR